MKDIPLDDDDDDKQERSRWQRPTFRHSKKDPRQQQSLEYRLDYSSSDEDGISSDDESSDSDYEDREEEQNTSSLARRNSTNMFSKGKTHERSRSYSGRSMLIGSQRSVLGFYVTPQEKPSPTKVRHNLTLSPQRQQRVIKVHLEHETLPQVVLFTSPNPGETSEIKVVVEDLRSSQQFNVSVCDKWNIAEVRKAFCDKQTLNAEEFEPLFESVDIPCRLDCTPAELDISCVRLSRSTRSRIPYDNIRFDCAENGDEPKCCNLDSLIDHILASDPFDMATCETLIYFVSFVTTPLVLLRKLIERFTSTNGNAERLERILTILLLWIDSNPQTIINAPDILRTFTAFLTTVTIAHSNRPQFSQGTLSTLTEHFRSQYFTPDLLAEISSRLQSALIAKGRKTTKGRTAVEWLCKALKFNLPDAKLVFHTLVLRGHIRALDPERPSAQRRYYFADSSSSAHHGMHKEVTDIPPERFAYQVALFLFNLFRKIDVAQEFSPMGTFSSCNEYLVAAARLTLWMRWEMLSPPTAKGRLKALKWLIRVAEASLSMGSFGGADIAASALDSVPLKRMKSLWAPLSAKKRAALTAVLKQVRPSDGYRGYHSAVAGLAASHLPVVPIIRVHLVEVAQAATVCDEMCWRKLFFAAVPVREVLAMQKVPYEPKFDKEAQEIIEDMCFRDDSLNDKMVYQTTLVIEPHHDQEEELKNASLMSIINGVEYIPLKK